LNGVPKAGLLQIAIGLVEQLFVSCQDSHSRHYLSAVDDISIGHGDSGHIIEVIYVDSGYFCAGQTSVVSVRLQRLQELLDYHASVALRELGSSCLVVLVESREQGKAKFIHRHAQISKLEQKRIDQVFIIRQCLQEVNTRNIPVLIEFLIIEIVPN